MASPKSAWAWPGACANGTNISRLRRPSQAQESDLSSINIIAGYRVYDADHGGIVGPDTAVGKHIAVPLHRCEERGRSRLADLAEGARIAEVPPAETYG